MRNILLNFTFTDNISTLPEKVQSAICQAIVDLDQYVDLLVPGRVYSFYNNYMVKRPIYIIDKNRSADPASYKRCEELRCDADVMEKMKHVYRALGITDASEMPITDEEKKQFNKKQKRNIILVLVSAVIIYLTLRWLTML